MPRGTTKTKAETKAETKIKHGPFDLVVHSFDGKLPGQDDYEPLKDRLRIGFQYGNTTVPVWLRGEVKSVDEVTAYDFLTNPKTGHRPGQATPPHGSTKISLQNGVSSWVDIPPLHIWRAGQWLGDIVWDFEFDLKDLPAYLRTKVEAHMKDGWPSRGTPEDLFNFWVVSGEGTTGNNLYRLYELPHEIAKRSDPQHPMMWRKELRDTYGNKGWGLDTSKDTTQTAPTTTKAPALPAGVRMRCPGCGHWYAVNDLSGHAQVCGKGEEADWAMMCHSDCGCENLDQASTPKPGFPRPKKVEEPKAEEKEAVTSNGASTEIAQVAKETADDGA